ncbi:MAG: S1C family serine protease [Chitinophagales bacterium]
MRKNKFFLGIVLLLVGIMLGGAAYSQYISRDIGALKDKVNVPIVGINTASGQIMSTPTDITGMVEKVSPAIVNIETTVEIANQYNPFLSDPFFRDFFGSGLNSEPETEQGIGTGFIITDTGYILTNNHVVDGASKIDVTVVGYSRPLTAKVVGSDSDLDLAVLKVNANKMLPTVPLGNSDKVKVGQWVVAIGNPYGLDHTVTMGVISAKERPLTIDNKKYKNLFQTDAAINPGNSGGPLLNTSGQVIAINTAVNSNAQGIGFAIPVNTAKDVLDQLINKGKVSHPYLGVYLQDISEQLAKYLGLSVNSGVLVADIQSGGPASRAGIKAGDVILSVDKHTVKDSSDLVDYISEQKVGDKVTVKILRDGKKIDIQVTLAEKQS